jgi:hypothetical protein
MNRPAIDDPGSIERDEAKGEETRGVAAARSDAAECAGKSPPREPAKREPQRALTLVL